MTAQKLVRTELWEHTAFVVMESPGWPVEPELAQASGPEEHDAARGVI